MIFTNDKAIYIQMADRLCDEILADKYKDDDSELTKDNKDITKITISGYCYPFKTMSDKTKGGKKIDIIVK